MDNVGAGFEDAKVLNKNPYLDESNLYSTIMGFVISDNSIIVYAIIAAMLIIVLALIFHSGFRKDMQSAEGEVNFAGLALKGIAPVLIFGLCLMALFKFKSEAPEINAELAIGHLKNDSQVQYITSAGGGGEEVELLVNTPQDKGTIIGKVELPSTQVQTKTVTEVTELGLEEMFDLANFYNISKKAKCGTYVFRMFEKREAEINDLAKEEQEKLALVIASLGETYYKEETKVDSLLGFIDALNNLSPKFKALRQAEFLYNVGIYTKDNEWRFKALEKYFEQYRYPALPDQSKKEALELYQFLSTTAKYRRQIAETIGNDNVVFLSNAIAEKTSAG